MNYDQHQTTSTPGRIASQDWFTANLQKAVEDIPKSKIICAIGNYGYDWSVAAKGGRVLGVETNNVQETWLHARESESDVLLDSDSLNPHFAYVEDTGIQHQVWLLDAVTALNQMRGARSLGIRTFALWRLGSEDRSLWQIWDNPNEPGAEQKLKTVPAGQDVEREAYGESLVTAEQPSPGARQRPLEHDALQVAAWAMTT